MKTPGSRSRPPPAPGSRKRWMPRLPPYTPRIPAGIKGLHRKRAAPRRIAPSPAGRLFGDSVPGCNIQAPPSISRAAPPPPGPEPEDRGTPPKTGRSKASLLPPGSAAASLPKSTPDRRSPYAATEDPVRFPDTRKEGDRTPDEPAPAPRPRSWIRAAAPPKSFSEPYGQPLYSFRKSDGE